MVRLAKKARGTSRHKVASVTALSTSISSDRRVERRFDSYNPHIAKIKCQMKTKTVKSTKFPSWIRSARNSVTDRVPCSETTRIVVRPRESTRIPRSINLAVLFISRRLAWFTKPPRCLGCLGVSAYALFDCKCRTSPTVELRAAELSTRTAAVRDFNRPGDRQNQRTGT